jgi:chromosome transmission fidelity protein 1
VLCIFYYFCF